MTQQRDIESLLDLWLSDGPIVAPDRVIDVVADRIERQAQRPAWRFHLREIYVNTILRAGAAVAAIAIVAVIGFNLLPNSSNGVGGGPATNPPSSEPSPTLTAAPRTVACEDDLPGCAGPLQAGEHRSRNFGPKLIYTTPTGWTNAIDIADIYKLDPPEATTPYILIWTNVGIIESSNSCAPSARASPNSTVQEWIDFLMAHPGLHATDPVLVDIGGSKGQSIDVTASADRVKLCPGDPNVPLIARKTAPISEYGASAGSWLHLTILDVRGTTVLIEVYGPASASSSEFAAAVAAAQPVIDTFRFGCGPAVPRPCTQP